MQQSRANLARLCIVLALFIVLIGCRGSSGSKGKSTGMFTGFVVNEMTGAPLAGAAIDIEPAVEGADFPIGADGSFGAELPVGAYVVTVTADDFEDLVQPLSILAGQDAFRNLELDPETPVKVTLTGLPTMVGPGTTFMLTANVTIFDGSTGPTFAWSQTNSVDAALSNTTSETVTITLGDEDAYRDYLLDHLVLVDRWGVLGINPHSFLAAAEVAFQCEVTTTSGAHAGTQDVETHLDFAAWATGLDNVPVNLPVMLSGREQEAYDWALTMRPAGSAAALNHTDIQFPSFTPDEAGTYELSVYDEDAEETVYLTVAAGRWTGIITGQDGGGRPTVSTECLFCHEDEIDDWRLTGHAEIFTNNINSGGHYSKNCFDCHTVGYHPDAENNGFDDQDGYDDFLATMFAGGFSHPDDGNWDQVLEDWPDVARLANIQCENCHGPQESAAHKSTGMGDTKFDEEAFEDMTEFPRTSLSADVCAYCHGEPPRHARFQQWEESKHARYDTALEEAPGLSRGDPNSCSKCHSANGFLLWEETGFDVDFEGTNIPEEDVHPITCVVCHDPHNVGTKSGHGNDVMLRVEGDSPELLGGFTATEMGHGATCIICHNSRRGEANDGVGLPDPDNYDRAPHGGSQGDILMGENAYYVTTGIRGSHSLFENTCSTCHLSLTPPPAELSYNLGGTNHTFEASTDICSDCHGDPVKFTGLENMVEEEMEELEEEIGGAIESEIAWLISLGYDLEIEGIDSEEDDADDIATTITDGSVFSVMGLSETHGRSAMDITVDGVTYYHVQLGGDTTVSDSEDDYGNLLDNSISGSQGLDLAKCNWNYWLIHSDGSHGAHNPDWVIEIIEATRNVVDGIWGSSQDPD